MAVRRLLGLLGAIAVTAGCTSAATSLISGSTSSTSGTSSPVQLRSTYDARPITFRYPSGWTAEHFTIMSSFSSPLVYLSNQFMKDPCVREVTSNVESISCEAWPVESLRPGGVVVAWSSHGFPSWTFADQPGRAITVDGWDAKMSTNVGDGCRELGADRQLTVIISRKLRGNWYELDACFRDPGASESVADVLALLDTVHISGH